MLQKESGIISTDKVIEFQEGKWNLYILQVFDSLFTICKSVTEICVKSTQGHSNTTNIINTQINCTVFKKKRLREEIYIQITEGVLDH